MIGAVSTRVSRVLTTDSRSDGSPGDRLAERVGFEPTVGISHVRFQDGSLKPLGHLSVVHSESASGRRTSVFDADAAVAVSMGSRSGSADHGRPARLPSPGGPPSTPDRLASRDVTYHNSEGARRRGRIRRRSCTEVVGGGPASLTRRGDDWDPGVRTSGHR